MEMHTPDSLRRIHGIDLTEGHLGRQRGIDYFPDLLAGAINWARQYSKTADAGGRSDDRSTR